jgi:hypothetical protein
MVQTQQSLRQAKRGVTLQQREVIRKSAARRALAIAKQSVQQTVKTVDYDRAWEEAKKHFDKGKGAAYLQHMEKEAVKDPYIGAVYGYIKQLDKSRRAGTTQFDPTTKKVITKKKWDYKTGETIEVPVIYRGDISPQRTQVRADFEAKEAALPVSEKKAVVATREVYMPTRKQYEELLERRMEPKVRKVETSFIEKIKDIPSKAVEKITGKKPREAFRFITGSQEEDITKPLTTKEVIYETAQVPIRATSIVSGLAGAGAEKITPESRELFTISAKETSFIEPQFGTVQVDPVTGKKTTGEKKIIIPERIISTPKPEQVRTVVKIGTELTAMGIAPLAFAPGFIVSGAEKALDKEKTYKERAFGVAEAGLGGFIVGGKAVRYLRTPIMTTKATRPIAKPIAVEVQAVKEIKGKPKVVSTFFRATETRAPSVTIETTKGRELLGLKPKKMIRKKAEVTLQFTPEPVVEGEIFKVAEQKLGKPSIKITRVAQISKGKQVSEKLFIRGQKGEVLPEERLRQLESFLTKKLPSEEGLVKLVADKEKLTTTLGISKDIKRIKITKRTLTDKPILDSKIKGTISISEIEQVGKVKEGEVFLVRGATKQIKSARPSPRGKVKESETILLKLKRKPSDIKEIDIIGKPSIKPSIDRKQILKKELRDTKLVSELVPAPAATEVKTVTTILKKPTTIIETALPAVSTQLKTTQLKTTQPQIISFEKPSVAQVQKPKEKQKQTEIQIQPKVEITKTIQKPKQIEILKSETTQIQKQKPIQDIAQISRLAKAQPQAQPQIQTQIQPSMQKPAKPKAPTKPLIAKPSLSLKGLVAKAEKGELFKVFAKKGEKDIVIAKAKTEAEAFEKLKKKLKGTLRASGYVEKGGKKIAPPILLNGEFRRSKRDEFRVVEKKAKRLRKGTTGKEVQYFRALESTKKKPKKNKGFFGF